MGGEAAGAFRQLTGDTESNQAEAGNEVLARGLMLIRASMIKALRLQLAIERRDRRLALQSMDDLVAIDAQLRDFVHELPPFADRPSLEDALDIEARALASEKLTLAAGSIGATEPWLDPIGACPVDSDVAEAATPGTDTSAATGKSGGVTARIAALLLALLLVLGAILLATGGTK